MKKGLALLLFLSTPALADSGRFTACEKQYRAEQKTAKEAAPKGFVPAPIKGKRAAFMVECLAK